jgi:peroxiredoxin
MTNINPGNKAPDFSLKGFGGQDYSLNSLICQFTFPFLERVYKRYAGDNVTILGISQDDAKATQKFASEFSPTLPMAIDAKGYPTSNAYGLTSVPTIFLIGTDGSVKITSMGFEKKGLEDIAAALAEHRKIAPAALFLPSESVPAHKPG